MKPGWRKTCPTWRRRVMGLCKAGSARLRPVRGHSSHQRVNSVFDANAYDFTYNDTYTLNTDGTLDTSSGETHFFFGPGGNIRIGFGTGSVVGVTAALKAPALSGPGVYINPTGVVNAASSSMFTASIAPGELLSVYGSNLAN